MAKKSCAHLTIKNEVRVDSVVGKNCDLEKSEKTDENYG